MAFDALSDQTPRAVFIGASTRGPFTLSDADGKTIGVVYSGIPLTQMHDAAKETMRVVLMGGLVLVARPRVTRGHVSPHRGARLAIVALHARTGREGERGRFRERPLRKDPWGSRSERTIGARPCFPA